MTSAPLPAALRGAAEASVVALAMAGDDTAFGELVHRRQSAVRSLLRRLCRDASQADDLAQQVFLQAWRSIGTLRTPAAFAGWLRTLAVNTWLQHLRANQQKLEPLPEDDVFEPGATPTTSERLDLDAALALLAPAARACVVLAYQEGLSHAEVSALTGLPVGTVKSHVTRSAARLREILHAYRSAA